MSKKSKYIVVSIILLSIMLLALSLIILKQNECLLCEYDARRNQRILESHFVQVDKNDTYGTICFLFYDKDKTDFEFAFYTNGGGLFKNFSAGGAPLIDENNDYRIEEFSEYSLFSIMEGKT